MRFNPHQPLVPRRPTPPAEELYDDMAATGGIRTGEGGHHQMHHTLERTKKLSCWHILSVSVAVFVLVVAAVILVANVTYYLNEDHMLERCTSSDAESFLPCHYIKLALEVVAKNVDAGTLRAYLHIAYLASIVFVTHYILATMTLMLGVATNKHFALVPWFVSQFVLALVLTVSMMLEMYTDHYRNTSAATAAYDDDVTARSKYFVMTTGALAFVVMNWVVNSVTFSRIRKLNGELLQTFDYARFDGRQ